VFEDKQCQRSMDIVNYSKWSTITLINMNQQICVTLLPIPNLQARKKSSLIRAWNASVVAISGKGHVESLKSCNGIGFV